MRQPPTSRSSEPIVSAIPWIGMANWRRDGVAAKTPSRRRRMWMHLLGSVKTPVSFAGFAAICSGDCKLRIDTGAGIGLPFMLESTLFGVASRKLLCRVVRHGPPTWWLEGFIEGLVFRGLRIFVIPGP